MSNKWIKWSERNEEFAPIFGLHKHEMFYPISTEAFLEEDCELKVLLGVDNNGPIYGKVVNFNELSLIEKIQWLILGRINNKNNYLDRHDGKIDIKKSAMLQQNLPSKLYMWGFRNQETKEAYITYWFFYTENYMIHRGSSNSEIIEVLQIRPDDWWTHEGDWEAVSLYFNDFEATYPTKVIFSQHVKPQSISWKNTEKIDGRIIVIPTLGSHANYNIPQRKTVFFFYDDVASPDILYYPKSIEHPNAKSYYLEELDPRHNHLWLNFKGSWGKSAGETKPAPKGPLMKKEKHLRYLANI